MRRNFSKGLARSVRQAALVSTLGLLVALAVGVGGFVLTTARGGDDRAVAATPAPSTSSPDVAPDALVAIPRPLPPTEIAASRALTVIPVPDEATANVGSPAEPPPAGTPASALAISDANDLVTAADFANGTDGTQADAPPLVAGDRVTVTISFYYCQRGTETAATGDGGGFCGAMRDGNEVYNGAAACDVAYLGQIFKIEGDPLDRVYRCADTGSAVHGLHRDIWFRSSDAGWAWQRSIGQVAVIQILP